MRKRNSKLRITALIVIPLLPLAIAFIAYSMWYRQGSFGLSHPVLDPLFSAIRIYGLSLDNMSQCDDAVILWLLEIARWGAMIVMATAVIKLLRYALQHVWTSIAARSKHSVALYGDAAPVAMMKAELGAKAIVCDLPERYFAANHVLAFHDSAQLYRFLGEHYTDLTTRKNARLFLYAESLIHPAQINANVFINNMAEACARGFWKKHWLRAEEKRIVLIGFGGYGGELLSQALRVNVFLDKRRCEYHIYGDAAQYRALHRQLDQIVSVDHRQPERDAVFFHQQPWYQELEEIRQADRIILCGDREAENIRALDQLILQGVRSNLYIRISSESVLRAFGRMELDRSIVSFGTDQELYAVDQVTNTTTISKGRLIHADYFFRSGCPNRRGTDACGKQSPVECLSCGRFKDDWDRHTSDYVRASSIAQADHIPVKIRELLQTPADDTKALAIDAYRAYTRLNEAEKRRFLELEHRRWMRFMYLRGWSYQPVRNNDAMQHNLLLPFAELPADEQQKDGSAYEVLKEVDEYEHFKRKML